MHFRSDDLACNVTGGFKVYSVSVPKVAYTYPEMERPIMGKIVVESHKTGNRADFYYDTTNYVDGKAVAYIWFNREHKIWLKMNLDG